ncbi:MAG: hypothetical protein E7633_07300 [Ruminococcaceae bacterium]|nr:hypothetical protein [Oscillospiraceae bacterium]
MSALYFIIDGGTTNTRINLVKDEKILDCFKISLGARAGIDNRETLKTEIKNGIKELLSRNFIEEKDICRILASGMITCEFGLINLPHIAAPAGIKELHDSMEEVILDEISPIPFVFIRGIKISSDSFEEADIMRGEETELIGINSMGIISEEYGKCIYILPGSHSKIIKIDSDGRIYSFSTMLTGEMIASLSAHTILKDAVDLESSEIDSEYLLKGYNFCKNEGLNKALFKTRILKNIFSCTKDETYSFFIGCVLSPEIEHIVSSDAETVVLGGKAQIKKAMETILKNCCEKKIISLNDNEAELSTVIGAIKIFELL